MHLPISMISIQQMYGGHRLDCDEYIILESPCLFVSPLHFTPSNVHPSVKCVSVSERQSQARGPSGVQLEVLGPKTSSMYKSQQSYQYKMKWR